MTSLPPLPDLTDDEVRALGEGCAVVRDSAVSPATVDAVRAAVRALRAADELRAAGFGRDGEVDRSLRGDHAAWLTDHADQDPALQGLWLWFDALRLHLQEATWVTLPSFTVQVALYPGDGARYLRHVDALPGQPNRQLTAILYLNPDWRPPHGGQLQVWEPGGDRLVAPLAGRLVLFRSEALPHAVLPSFHERWAVTAWYRGVEPLPVLPDAERVREQLLG